MSWTEFHPLIQEATLTTFAVGLLVLLVLAIRKPFAKRYGAKAAYLLWALPLARFITPPLPGNWSLAGLLGFNRPAPIPAEAEFVPNEFVMAPVLERLEVAVTAETAPAAVTPIREFASLNAAEPAGTSLLEATLAQAPLILTSVWLVGVALWLGRSVYQQRQFLELIEADSEPADPNTAEETVRIARQLGIKRVPEVRASLLCSGPLVTGLKNPVILLPMWFEEDYDAAERRDALVHELMHLKRRDLWAFQAARIVAATQWFNPLAYMALRAFRTDQEAACDADVIARAKLSPAAYGRTLVKAARLARPSDRRIAAASLTLAHPIKERLIMMTHPTPTLRSRLMGGALAVGLGAGAIFATASCTSSVAQELDGAPQAEANTEGENVFVLEADHDMDFSVIVDGETFSFSMADMPPMPAFPGFEGMNFEQNGNSFRMEFDTEKLQAMEGSPEFAEWESKMEAWGEEMEVWGEIVEERAEAWAEEFEPKVEAWAEANAERWADQVELMVERAEAQAERAEAMSERERERAERRAESQNRWVERNGEYKGVTSPETRDFGTKNFSKVEVGSGISMVYTQDPNASVTAELKRGSWDQVEISVNGDTLTAKRAKNSKWGRYGPQLTVYAASPNLKSVDASSGSSFKGNVVAGNLSVDASSGSSLSMEGACKSLTLDASSGSSISMDKLECENTNVDASSGSSIRVFASKKADIDASSGSSISVSGKPTDVTTDKSSGASVRIR
jgi:beta-lactamase regulating signal transducer with metallopeptidase domain